MKRVMCLMIGNGIVDMKIDEDLSVAKLKEKIDTSLSNLQASKMTLYLAKKSGHWLNSNDPDVALLKQGIIPPSIRAIMTEEMDDTYCVNDPEFGLPDGTQSQDVFRKIHLLVKLPSGHKASLVADRQMKRSLHERLVPSKRKRYNHAEITSTEGQELLEDFNIRVIPTSSVNCTVHNMTTVEPFSWTSEPEVEQCDRYQEYFANNIGRKLLQDEDLCVFAAHDEEDILSVNVPRSIIELRGQTNLLILSGLVEDTPYDVKYLPRVKMLIKLKKAVDSIDDYQAISELIALELRADEPVMALLSDLNNDWRFFWFSEKDGRMAIIVCKVSFRDPSQALQVIRSVLTQSGAIDEMEIPLLKQDKVKRRKLTSMLHVSQYLRDTDDSGGGVSIRTALRQYCDVASMLGPDDEMARAVADQIVRTIPAFSFYHE